MKSRRLKLLCGLLVATTALMPVLESFGVCNSMRRPPRRYKTPAEKRKYYEPDPAEEFAEKEVGEYFSMAWENTSFKMSKRKVSRKIKYKSLEWILSKQSFLENYTGKKPILLFVYTTEKRVISKKTKPRPTAQHLRSEKLETDLFEHSSLKMPITTRFFTCYRMDIAKVTEKDWPELNTTKAPFVAIFTPDGKLLSIHKSGLSAVFAGMAKAAKKCEVDLPAAYRDADNQIRSLYENEVKLYRLREALEKAEERAKPKGDRKVSPNRQRDLAKAQKLVKECEAQNKKIKVKYEQILIGHSELAAKTATKADKDDAYPPTELNHDLDHDHDHDH